MAAGLPIHRRPQQRAGCTVHALLLFPLSFQIRLILVALTWRRAVGLAALGAAGEPLGKDRKDRTRSMPVNYGPGEDPILAFSKPCGFFFFFFFQGFENLSKV